MKKLYFSMAMLGAALAATAQLTVPEGTELSAFISENVPADSQDEITIRLQPGVTYQLSDSADFRLSQVTLCGDSEKRPVVNITGEGSFITQNGLSIKDINFDMTEAGSTSFIKLSMKPDSCFSTKGRGMLDADATGTVMGGFVMLNPISISGCDFRNIPNSILSNNYAAWAVHTFIIDNCVLQFNKKGSDAVFDFTTPAPNNDWAHFGQIAYLTLSRTTFYNLTDAKARFIRYCNRNNATPAKAFGVGSRSVHSIDACTFYRTFTYKEFANNTPKTDKRTIEIDNSIFYDVSRLDKFFEGCPVDMTKTNNMAWLAGYDDDGVKQPMRDGVKQISYIEDPEFKGPCDVAFDLALTDGGVSFTPLNETAVNNRIGDPRWLPGATAIVNIAADETGAPVEYFNLQGIRVTGNTLTPGIYIKREGSRTAKVCVK